LPDVAWMSGDVAGCLGSLMDVTECCMDVA
jgi:hypothetical protein